MHPPESVDHPTALAERVNFMRLTDEKRSLLRDIWPKIEVQLDEILTGFYQHLWRFDDPRGKLGSERRVVKLTSSQKEHWKALFSGRFDQDYLRRVTAVGRAHQRVGIEPRWYLGAYSYLLDRLYLLIDQEYAFSLRRRRATCTAVMDAVFLDMDISISVYHETEMAARAERQRALDTCIGRFDSESEEILGGVAASLGQVSSSAQTVTELAGETSRKSAAVAGSAEQTATNASAVAAAAEQLTAAIAEISRQLAYSSEVVRQSAERAQKVNATAETLNQASARIGDVVRLIGEVAGKTNLLALNATIEAARAGDAGRGFAVVAGEVKALANQTARATKDITEQIGNMQAATAETVTGIGAILEAIENQRGIAVAISSAMEQQSAATQEISRNAGEAVTGTQVVAQEIGTVSANAGRTESETGQALTAVASLVHASDRLRDRIRSFFDEVRAAS